MKLGIIIPLKSKQISKNWLTTSQALKATLNSILQQSVDKYEVVVCGHDKPDFLEDTTYQSINFVTTIIPAPDRNSPNFSHRDLIIDKNTKIAIGVKFIKPRNMDYWYQLDSDDLLHRDFVKIVQKIDGKAGAIIEGGYIIYNALNRAITTDEMSQYCGSTSILADKYVSIPEQFDEESIKQLPWANYPHMAMHNFFKHELQQPFESIHEKVLGYVLATGDNISDKWRDSPIKALKAYLKPLIKGRKITTEIIKQFSMLDCSNNKKQ